MVDDHDGVRATTAAMLEDLGHQVTQAGDGNEAPGIVAGDPGAFDVIVGDYAMPHLSGAELTGVMVLAKPFTPDQIRSALSATTAGRAKTATIDPAAE